MSKPKLGFYVIVVSATLALVLACPPVETPPSSEEPPPAPSAPAALTVSQAATGDGIVSISWDPVSDATSYNLYWTEGSTITKETGTKVEAATSPVVMNNLASGVEYAFAVSTVNSEGEGDIGQPVTKTLTTSSGSHVYVAGNIAGKETGPFPAYWRDGHLVQLGTTAHYSAGHAVASGGHVYVFGWDPTDKPVTWTDGTLAPLPLPEGSTFAYYGGMVVVNTDVYIAATVNLNNLHAPLYWKNGVEHDLALPGTDTQGDVSGVSVSGTDVYIIGFTSTPTVDNQPVYWKNGEAPVVLDQGTGNAWGWTQSLPYGGFPVVGSDFYAFGTVYDTTGGGGGLPVYWKNGKLSQVENTPGYVAMAMTVSGSDVYLAGATEPNSDSKAACTPTYWKNTARTSLPLGSATTATADLILVTGTDTYVAGDQVSHGNMWTSADPCLPLLWKNDSLVSLQFPTGDSNAKIWRMAAAGSDVYIEGQTGTAKDGNFDTTVQSHAVYWKNGNLNVLPTGDYPWGGTFLMSVCAE